MTPDLYAVALRCARIAADPLTLPHTRAAAVENARRNAADAYAAFASAAPLSPMAVRYRDGAALSASDVTTYSAHPRLPGVDAIARCCRRTTVKRLRYLAAERGGPLPWSHEASAGLRAHAAIGAGRVRA